MNLKDSTSHGTNTPFRFTFISTCPEAWGGSEELWSGAAQTLLEAGHELTVFKTRVDYQHYKIKKLESLGAKVHDLLRVHFALITRLISFAAPSRFFFYIQEKQKHLIYTAYHLKRNRPDLVVVSQGDNYDALHFTKLCRKLNIPYVLISQKATDFHWPEDYWRNSMQDAFKYAVTSYFVSHHNQKLTEEQINYRLPNAKVVSNPFMVPNEGVLPWPNREGGHYHLACVGRMYLKDKGQDMLLHVLSKEKWKQRNLHVRFFGSGSNQEGLKWLAEDLGVKNVSFAGKVSDVPGIWRESHALIMPSRSEGLPLSLMEAMMCGRTAIVTDVGGNAEVLEDEITGFLCDAAPKDIDDALERAWNRRDEWQAMGEVAAKRIRELVPSKPIETFTEELLETVKSVVKSKS